MRVVQSPGRVSLASDKAGQACPAGVTALPFLSLVL